MVDKRMYIPSSPKIYCSTPVHDAVQLKKTSHEWNNFKGFSSAAQSHLMFSMSNVTIHSKEIILIKPSISSFAAEEPDNSNDRKRENILVFVGK